MASSSATEPFARLGDIVVRAADAATLRPCCWLNDQAIAYLFESISRRAATAGAEVILLEPSTTFMAVMINDPAALREMWSVPTSGGSDSLLSQLEAAQLVLMPVNNNDNASKAEGGGHWSLLVFRREGNANGRPRYEHYDSCGKANASVAKSIALTLSTLLLGPKPGTLQLVNMDCPQQANGFDCGMYVLAFAEVLALAPTDELAKAPSAAVNEALHALTPVVVTEKRVAWHAKLMAAVEQGRRD